MTVTAAPTAPVLIDRLVMLGGHHREAQPVAVHSARMNYHVARGCAGRHSCQDARGAPACYCRCGPIEFDCAAPLGRTEARSGGAKGPGKLSVTRLNRRLVAPSAETGAKSGDC